MKETIEETEDIIEKLDNQDEVWRLQNQLHYLQMEFIQLKHQQIASIEILDNYKDREDKEVFLLESTQNTASKYLPQMQMISNVINMTEAKCLELISKQKEVTEELKRLDPNMEFFKPEEVSEEGND